MKKTLCTIAVAGLMVFGGGVAANAATPDPTDKYMQQQIAKSLKLQKKQVIPPKPVYPGYTCDFRFSGGAWIGYCW